MKKAIILIILLITSFAYAEQKLVDEHISTTYIVEGKIDNKYPIKMHLNVKGEEVTGKYYYTKNKQYIKLEGKLDNGTLSLEEYIEDDEYNKEVSGYFKGKFNKDRYTFNGDWTNAKNKKSMPFKLTKSAGINGVEIRQATIKDDKYRFSYSIQYPIINGAEKIVEQLKADKTVIDRAYKAQLEDYDPKYDVHEEELRLSFEYVDEKSITFIMYWWSFTGGAHGNAGNAGATFNVETGKHYITADLFSENYKSVLNALLRKRILENYEKEAIFNIDEVEFNDNFYVDVDGIHYMFTPYEIAPWSTGHVYASFTFDELKPYVKKDSPLAYLFGINEKK